MIMDLHTRVLGMIGYGTLNWSEVRRGLGRFAPVTAANWSEHIKTAELAHILLNRNLTKMTRR